MPILPEHQVRGRGTVDRSYLLLDQGVQLTRPAVFDGPVEGWWYVDVVDIEVTDAGLVVHDLYVDLLVPPGAERYYVLDLDELADALGNDEITAAQCGAALRSTQRFVDRHLRASDRGSVAPPTNFPPAGIAALEKLPRFHR